jgi:glycosyltransferase involved in cell wall biosynthesis
MTKMLRIVHLNASPAGGAFVAAQRLSLSLNKIKGVHSVHLVFEGQSGDYLLWADSWIKRKIAFAKHVLEKLDFLRFEKNKSIRFAFSHAPFGIDITTIPQIKNADIIHLHWVNKGFLSLEGITSLIQTNKTIVWTCHDMWPFTGGCYHPRGCQNYAIGCGNCQYLKSPENNDLSKIVFDKKHKKWGSGEIKFALPSYWLLDRANLSGVIHDDQKSKMTVIPNPIDVNYFRPATSSERLESQKSFGLNSNIPTLMFSAANLSNQAKGFQEFREICKLLKSRGKEIQALIIGDSRTMELDLNIPTKHLGFVSDLSILRMAYWSSIIYVTTSHEENLPTTIMESLACGVPVAAFSVGGIPEMIVENETGYLAEKLDSTNLANSISNHLSLNEESIKNICEKCNLFATENYASDLVANQYLAFYLQGK